MKTKIPEPIVLHTTFPVLDASAPQWKTADGRPATLSTTRKPMNTSPNHPTPPALSSPHTPTPWATDITIAAETIEREGAYSGFRTLKEALESIECAKDIRTARKFAKEALEAEQNDSRISGSVIYQNDGSGGQGNQICSFEHDPENEMRLDVETCANAALIVRAVNSFDAMREALGAMLSWESPDGIDRVSTPYLQQARAALALATPPERE